MRGPTLSCDEAVALGPAAVWLDCRASLADPRAGRAAWAAARIPGARHFDLERDASGPPRPGAGRHPLPDPEALAAKLGGWGVDHDVPVLAYDDAGGCFAARAWALLRWLGHERAAVLDGGWPAWQAAGLPIAGRAAGASAEPPPPAPRSFAPRLRPEVFCDAEAVERALAQGRPLLDARAPERFAGDHEPIDPVAGHIPGARNLPWTALLDADRRLLDPAELRARFAAAGVCAPEPAPIVSCGSGVTACALALAWAALGRPSAPIYAGSWSGWIDDPARPRATGPG